jgi:para-aminobenzoate synthetase / 4-amino-4-deoxychorismate lyase
MITACKAVEAAVQGGDHAVMLIPYDAAPAFDPALQVHAPGVLPLVWVGLYGERHDVQAGEAGLGAGPFTLGAWRVTADEAAHAEAVQRIRQYIGAGDAYQVNFTFPVQADFAGDPAGLYQDMCRGQGSAALCAYLDFGDVAVLSASPELFFSFDETGRIRTRPMKGTRRRGLWTAEDDQLRESLEASLKDRAENLMIVDLLRNDLGRIAESGSVDVTALWDVEQYDTVWQMTSTIMGQVRRDVGLHALLAALFPCGSVTGAPKVRASEIIAELEIGPRGAYTGTIGYISPSASNGHSACPPKQDGRALSGMEAVFNVAIRTVVVDREAGLATAGVGGGITWDSEAASEYQECLDKVRFLPRAEIGSGLAIADEGCHDIKGAEGGSQDFGLFETLLFEADMGYYLLERHLRRLTGSARYFGFACNETHVRGQLARAVGDRQGNQRVRLSLARDGSVSLAVADIGDDITAMTVILCSRRVNREDIFLYHKTTRRVVYDNALTQARSAGADEAILCNDRGELTECTIGNIVVEQAGRRVTPSLSCGLLPGTLRQELLDTGRIEEDVLTVAELYAADAVYLINSVRRWIRLEVLPAPAPTHMNQSPKERVACIR